MIIRGLWGTQINPQEKKQIDASASFKISMASIYKFNSSARTSIYITFQNSTFLLCSLTPEKIEQQVVDITCLQGESVTFISEGPNTIHLIGNYISQEGIDEDLDNESLFMEIDDEGSKDVHEHQLDIDRGHDQTEELDRPGTLDLENKNEIKDRHKQKDERKDVQKQKNERRYTQNEHKDKENNHQHKYSLRNRSKSKQNNDCVPSDRSEDSDEDMNDSYRPENEAQSDPEDEDDGDRTEDEDEDENKNENEGEDENENEGEDENENEDEDENENEDKDEDEDEDMNYETMIIKYNDTITPSQSHPPIKVTKKSYIDFDESDVFESGSDSESDELDLPQFTANTNEPSKPSSPRDRRSTGKEKTLMAEHDTDVDASENDHSNMRPTKGKANLDHTDAKLDENPIMFKGKQFGSNKADQHAITTTQNAATSSITTDQHAEISSLAADQRSRNHKGSSETMPSKVDSVTAQTSKAQPIARVTRSRTASTKQPQPQAKSVPVSGNLPEAKLAETKTTRRQKSSENQPQTRVTRARKVSDRQPVPSRRSSRPLIKLENVNDGLESLSDSSAQVVQESQSNVEHDEQNNEPDSISQVGQTEDDVMNEPDNAPQISQDNAETRDKTKGITQASLHNGKEQDEPMKEVDSISEHATAHETEKKPSKDTTKRSKKKADKPEKITHSRSAKESVDEPAETEKGASDEPTKSTEEEFYDQLAKEAKRERKLARRKAKQERKQEKKRLKAIQKALLKIKNKDEAIPISKPGQRTGSKSKSSQKDPQHSNRKKKDDKIAQVAKTTTKESKSIAKEAEPLQSEAAKTKKSKRQATDKVAKEVPVIESTELLSTGPTRKESDASDSKTRTPRYPKRSIDAESLEKIKMMAKADASAAKSISRERGRNKKRAQSLPPDTRPTKKPTPSVSKNVGETL